jgi:hypothetical protein
MRRGRYPAHTAWSCAVFHTAQHRISYKRLFCDSIWRVRTHRGVLTLHHSGGSANGFQPLTVWPLDRTAAWSKHWAEPTGGEAWWTRQVGAEVSRTPLVTLWALIGSQRRC